MSVTGPDELTIREADMGDFDALVAAHGAAFAGTMGVALGMRYREAFIRQFIREPDQIALIAVRGGVIVGYTLGRGIESHNNDKATNRAAAIGLLTHPWLIFRRTVRREALAKTIHRKANAAAVAALPKFEADWVALGCVPSERGRGTSRALEMAIEEAFIAKGWPRIMLSVYRSNTVARNLYKSRGFVEIDHISPELLHGFKDTTKAGTTVADTTPTE